MFVKIKAVWPYCWVGQEVNASFCSVEEGGLQEYNRNWQQVQSVRIDGSVAFVLDIRNSVDTNVALRILLKYCSI